MACNPAAQIQGPGPDSGDGHPVDVNVLSAPPIVIEGCVQVEDCPAGTPVRVQGTHTPVDGDANPTNSVDTTARLEIFSEDFPPGWERARSTRLGLGALFAPRVLAVVGHLVGALNNAFPWANTERMFDEGGANSGMALNLPPFVPYYSVGYKGVNPALDGYARARTPRVFYTVAAVAAGNTALWTPPAGQRFRLMRYCIVVTGDAIQAVAGVVTISLFDGAAGATGQVHSVFVPAAAVNTQSLYTSGWIDLGNGFASAAVNNVLNVNLSAALTGGVCRVIACGTEEL